MLEELYAKFNVSRHDVRHRKTMEDDYGMIDGVINNGKKEEPVEKASVLDQLKEKQEAVPPAPPRRCCEEKEL